MNFRRQRCPQTGLSNLDHRSTHLSQNIPPHHTIEVLSQPRNKNFSALLEQRMKKVLVNPMEETKQFYHEVNKHEKIKTIVSQGRSSQLEEKEKRKRVFTGDSNLIFDEKVYWKEDKGGLSPKKVLTDLPKEKHDAHAKGIQETQLIGMEAYSKDTLGADIDLKKIREVRRAIRRRYANQRNFQKIFNLWDEDHEGQLSAKNVSNMLSKMGLKLNEAEAQTLIASADQTGNAKLSLDEFLDLIFNDNDMLNINLKKLDFSRKTGTTDEQVMDILQQDALAARKNRHKNQLSLFLKNKANFIRNACLDVDQKKDGYLDLNIFNQIMEKLKFSSEIMSEDDKKEILEPFVDNNRVNYKNFIEKFRAYEFLPEEAYINNDITKSKPSLRSKQMQVYEMKPNSDQNIIITAPGQQTINKLESQRQRFKKIFRVLNSCFENKEAFKQFLQKQIGLNKKEFDEANVHHRQLEKVFNGLFSSLESARFHPADLSAFLSIFTYNALGETKIADITDQVYLEDDFTFYTRIAYPTHGPIPQIKDVPSSTLVAEASLQPILDKFDSLFFGNQTSAYKTFKSFDLDKDGFISREDLTKKLGSLAFLNQNEINTFIDYVDKDRKGYVNFKDFCSKVKPSMNKTDELGRWKEATYILPSREGLRRRIDELEGVKEKTAQLIQEFKPKADSPTLKERPLTQAGFPDIQSRSLGENDPINEKQRPKTEPFNFRSTRFGSTPAWNNTFVNHIQAIDEKQRFSFDPMKNYFQKEEKSRKEYFDKGNMEKKRKWMDILQDKLKIEEEIKEKRNEKNLEKKSTVQWAYEHKCKLRNTLN